MKVLVLSTGTAGTAVAQRLGAEGHAARIVYAGAHNGVGLGFAGVEVVDGWREQLAWADLVVAVGDGWRQWRNVVRRHGRLIFGLQDATAAPMALEAPTEVTAMADVLRLWNGRKWMSNALLAVSEHRHLSGGYGVHVADGMGWLAYPLASVPTVVAERAAALEASLRDSDYRGPVTFRMLYGNVPESGALVDACVGHDLCVRGPHLALLAEASTAPLIDVLAGIAGGTLDEWPMRQGAAVAAQRLSVAPWPFATTDFARVDVEIAEGALRHLWLHGVGRELGSSAPAFYTDCRGDIGFAVAWGGTDSSPRRRVREALRRVERVAEGVSSWALQLRSDISGVLGARFGALIERGAV